MKRKKRTNGYFICDFRCESDEGTGTSACHTATHPISVQLGDQAIQYSCKVPTSLLYIQRRRTFLKRFLRAFMELFLLQRMTSLAHLSDTNNDDCVAKYEAYQCVTYPTGRNRRQQKSFNWLAIIVPKHAYRICYC